ncbi:MAG: tripartite tricarboxylate transporter substrate-binding protein [Burkholderiales bacterium]
MVNPQHHWHLHWLSPRPSQRAGFLTGTNPQPRIFALVVAATFTAMTGLAHAQQRFPSKPMRIVASTTAGSQPDGLARFIAQKMSDTWGVAVIIDNRPAAGGTLAASTVAKATPDGHTLLYALPNFVISAAMQPGLPYDPLKDFTGAAHIGISTNVLVATPALGVRSLRDFTALAQSQPGKMILSTSAAGSAAHLSGLRFNLAAGIKAVHVAFKGGPDSMIEVLGGRAHYHIGTLGVTLPFVKEGKLTALAVITPQRTPVLPEVPALGEIHAEFTRPETSHGLMAPAGTPRPIINQLGKEVLRILDLPEMKERMQSIGYVSAPGGPEEYNKILRAQIETMSKLVRDTGLRAK